MSNLDIVMPEEFAGNKTFRFAKGPDGPREYVKGRLADYVPTRTGPGDVYLVDDKFQGEAITFDGVNEKGKMALLNAAQEIVNAGQNLTHSSVLEALRSQSLEARTK